MTFHCAAALDRLNTAPRAASLLTATLLAAATAQLGAQEPPLRPVAEHLREAQIDSLPTVRYVARRCAALFSLVSDQYETRRDPGTAEMYAGWSIGFEVFAAQTEVELGTPPEEAVERNESAITELRAVVRERMNRIRWLGNDPLLSSDVRTCRQLVDDLGLERPPL